MDSFLNKPATSSSSIDNETLLDDIIRRIKVNDQIVCERIQSLERATGAYAHAFISNALKNNPKEVIAILHDVLKDHPIYFDSLTEGLKKTVDADHERLDAMAKEFHATQETLHHQISVHEKMMGAMKERLDSMNFRLENITVPDASALYPRIIIREVDKPSDTIRFTNPVPDPQATAGYLPFAINDDGDDIVISGGSNLHIGCHFGADGSVHVGDVPPRTMNVASSSSNSEPVNTCPSDAAFSVKSDHMCADVNVLYPGKYKIGKGISQDAYVNNLSNNAKIMRSIVVFIYQTWWGECPDKIEAMEPDEGDEIAVMADALSDFYKGIVTRFAKYKRFESLKEHYTYNIREAWHGFMMACINLFHDRADLHRGEFEADLINIREGRDHGHTFDKSTYNIPMKELHKLGVAALKLENNTNMLLVLERGNFYIAHFDFMEYFNGINKLAFNFQQFLSKAKSGDDTTQASKKELLDQIEKHKPVLQHINVINTHYKNIIPLIDTNDLFSKYAQLNGDLTRNSLLAFVNAVVSALRNAYWVYFGLCDEKEHYNYIAWRLMGAVRDANAINEENAEIVCSKIANAFIAVYNICIHSGKRFKLNDDASSMFRGILVKLKCDVEVLQTPTRIQEFGKAKMPLVKNAASVYDMFLSLISISVQLEYHCSDAKEMELHCAALLMQIRFQFNSFFELSKTKKRNRDTKVRLMANPTGIMKLLILDDLHSKLDYLCVNKIVPSVRDAVDAYRNAFLACFGPKAWRLKPNQLPWANGEVESDKLVDLSNAITICVNHLVGNYYKTVGDYHQVMDTFLKKYLRTNGQVATYITDFLQYRFNLISEIGVLAFAVKNTKLASLITALFVNIFTTTLTCGTHNLYFYDALVKQVVYNIRESKDNPFVYTKVSTITFPTYATAPSPTDFIKNEIKNMDNVISSHSDIMDTMKNTIKSQQDEIDALRANLLQLTQTIERLQECVADKVADEHQEDEAEPKAKAQKPSVF